MLPVTLGTGRSIHFTSGNELAMNAGLEFFLNGAVALAAGRRDVEEVD